MKCNSKTVNEYLCQLATGNINALELLYRYTEELVYSYILSVIGNNHLSEDIKQDTYIKIYENIDKFRPGKNALAWVIQIAKNLALNAIDKQKRSPILFDGSEDEIKSIADISKDYSVIEDKTLLNYILGKLPEPNREVIMLYLFGEYSQKEISAILNLPLTTIHWRYHASVKKLKQYYKEGEFQYE